MKYFKKYQQHMECNSLMVLTEGRCQVFGVKKPNGPKRRQMLSISKGINHIWTLGIKYS